MEPGGRGPAWTPQEGPPRTTHPAFVTTPKALTETNLTAPARTACHASHSEGLGGSDQVRFVPCGSVEPVLLAGFEVHIGLLHLRGLLLLDLRVALTLDAHHLVVSVAHHLLALLKHMQRLNIRIWSRTTGDNPRQKNRIHITSTITNLQHT